MSNFSIKTAGIGDDSKLEDSKLLVPSGGLGSDISRQGLSEAVDHFLNKIVLPWANTGVFRGKIEKLSDGSGCWISHTAELQGVSREFQYRIVESDSAKPRITYNSFPLMGGEIQVPSAEYTPELEAQLQAGWKRLTIADPIFYERHWREKFSPEPYQERALDALISSLMTGGKTVCYMPTGTGKTVVALMTWHHLREALNKADPNRTPGKLVYIVNRNLLLQGAEDQLKRMYGDRYTIGRIYDQEFTLGRDAIFATPSSLSQGGRIRRLIDDGPIDLLVTDETHHLPAQRNSSVDGCFNTRKLGLSATIERSDNRSVISKYEYDVAFSYSKLEAYHDGNLVGIEYIPADIGLDRTRSLSDPQQLERVFKVYERVVAHSGDNRALFICSSIPEATRLANYYNENSSGRTEAVALHSDSLRENKDLFHASFHAWKYGAWEKGSPFADRTVPKIAVTVDMINEGVDLPPIGQVFLLAQHASVFPFIQIVGRVLRPFPGKQFARVVDIAGAYKHPAIRQHLDAHADMIQWRFGQHEEGVLQGDVHEPRPIEVDTTMEDAPEYLARLFGNYDSIPKSGMQLLDRYIDLKLALEPTTSEALLALAPELQGNPSNERAEEIRKRLRPVFHDGDEGTLDEGEVVERTKATLITGLRLADRIFENAALGLNDTITFLAKVFPEFQDNYEKLLRNRSANLRVLRKDVLQRSHQELAEQLYAIVKDLDDTEFPESFRSFIQVDVKSPFEHERGLFLRAAEGYLDRNPEENRAHLTRSKSPSRSTLGGDSAQRVSIAALLRLPELNGRIAASEFDLPKEKFKDLLQERGVFATISAQMSYATQKLQAAMRQVEASTTDGNLDTLESAVASLAWILSPEFMSLDTFWSEYPVSFVARTVKWVSLLRQVEQHVSDAKLLGSLQQIRDAFESGLDGLAARSEAPLTKNSRDSVIVSLSGENSFEVFLKTTKRQQEEFTHLCTLERTIGFFGRAMVAVKLSGGLKALEELSANKVTHASKALYSASLELIQKRWGEHITYMFEDAPDQSGILEKFRLQLIKDNHAVIVGVTHFDTKVKRSNPAASATGSAKTTPESFGYTYQGAQASNLPYVDSNYADYVWKVTHAKLAIPPTKRQKELLQLEVACAAIPRLLEDTLPTFEKNLATFSNDKTCRVAIDYLTALLRECKEALKQNVSSFNEVLRFVNSIVEDLGLGEDTTESLRLRLVRIALREMSRERSTRDRLMLNRTPISPLVPEEIALIAPALTKLALLQYFRDNGHSEKFNTELEGAEKLLSKLLLQKKTPGGEALTAFRGQIAALQGALDSAQRETLGFPVAQPPSYTAYHTKHEGKVVTHKSEECPVARHQEPLGRQPSGDDTSVKCQVCVESTQ